MPRSRSDTPLAATLACACAVAAGISCAAWAKEAGAARPAARAPTVAPAPASPAPARELPRFDGRRAFALLKKQVEFGPRVPGSAAHEAAAAWLKAQLAASCEKVTPHTFTIDDPYGSGKLSLTNIKASLRPQAPDRVTFAAHWDCRPRADREPGGPVDQPIPGANDGASGVAVLLALAELLHAAPPPLGVDLLLFDGEDYGRESDVQHYLIGSRRFAADYPGYRPRALILLDMVGDADLHIPMEATGLQRASDLTRTVFDRAQALGLPAFEPIPGPAVIDDHLPFLQVGIPSIDLIDLDYPEWHTLGDTPSACSPESLEQVGRLLVALVFVDFAAQR
jgi:glutaminyl-peptide cyclotransferase